MIDIKMEELIPIVGKLAEGYTSFESTSVTYEKAEQFMNAVLYCIHEVEIFGNGGIVPMEELPAGEMYEMGLALAEQKVRQALKLYNGLAQEFKDYDNLCLRDTVVKGLPEFFKWYDVKYEPQSTVVMLDYPVLRDLSGYTGIDKIYEYICCIRLEQSFLSIFPKGQIIRTLQRADMEYEESVENICGTFLMSAICHVMAEKPLMEEFGGSELIRLKEKLAGMKTEEIKEQFRDMVKGILQEMPENREELYRYLAEAEDDTACYLKYGIIGD